MRTTTTLIFIALLPLLLVVGTGCDDGQASTEASSETSEAPSSRQATRVETLKLQPTRFEDVIEITGSVEALNDAVLSAQTSGTLVRIADRGDLVESGTRVAQVENSEEASDVEQLQAQYDLAQDQFERQEPLYRDSIISALEYEQVRSNRNSAKAALEAAKTRLAKTRVTTPFTGIIEERFVETGEQVQPGMQVARVVDTRRVRVSAGVPERYANDIRPGTPVRLDFRRYGGDVRNAEVTFAGRAINPDTRTFPIEVEVSNADGRLKPEMVARLRVTREQFESAIVVPRTAVVRDEVGTHVYAVVESDDVLRAEKRRVVLGPSYGERSVILSGLTLGESVVISGQNNLAPGDPVRVTTEYDRLQPAGTPYEGEETEGLAQPANPEASR